MFTEIGLYYCLKERKGEGTSNYTVPSLEMSRIPIRSQFAWGLMEPSASSAKNKSGFGRLSSSPPFEV